MQTLFKTILSLVNQYYRYWNTSITETGTPELQILEKVPWKTSIGLKNYYNNTSIPVLCKMILEYLYLVKQKYWNTSITDTSILRPTGFPSNVAAY